MSIQVEKWNQLYPDCLPLFVEHKAEVGEVRINYNPDIEKAAILDKSGRLLIVTARDENEKLQGYLGFFMDTSLECKGLLVGTQMLWFVTKSARHGGVGVKLYLEAIKQMRALGVKNIYPHRWLTVDSSDLDRFFLKLGAVPLEYEYSLWIGDK